MAIFLTILGCWQAPVHERTFHYFSTMLAYPIIGIMAVHVIDQTTNQHGNIRKTFALIWVFSALTSLAYPLGWYLLHMQEAHILYGQGSTLPVFMDNDHVRYALFLNAALLLAWQYRKENRWMLAASIVLMIATLLLSVRTGWVGLVIIMGLEGIRLVRKQDKGRFVQYLAMIASLTIIAYYLFPTIQQKIRYMRYDWEQYQQGRIDHTLSDATRLVLNRSAWQAIEEGKTNIGWANVPIQLQESFRVLYPQQQIDFGWPFNQWLLWWMGAGVLGAVLFSLWLFYPMYLGIRQKHSGMISWSLVMVASCITEATLGYQFGVWLHIWPLVLIGTGKARYEKDRELISGSDNS